MLHNHILVNGKKVNIPSYLVKEGDVITIRNQKKQKGPWRGLAEVLKNHEPPSWLSVQPDGSSIKVTGSPTEDEIKSMPFDSKLIVEFYSR